MDAAMTDAKVRVVNEFSKNSLTFLRLERNEWIPDTWQNCAPSKLEADMDALMSEVLKGPGTNTLSLWANVRAIAPGCKISANGMIAFDWQPIHRNAQIMIDPAQALAENISQTIRNYPPDYWFVVRFTGGLDSTGILLALLESVDCSKILAVTYRFAFGSCNADERCSRELCQKYGIRLIVLDFEPKDLFAPLNQTVPALINSRYMALSFYRKEREAIAEATQGRYAVFDGHGGDHVFCEVIPPSIVRELVAQHRPIRALSTLLALARLQGNGLFTTFRRRPQEQTMGQRYFHPNVQPPKSRLPDSVSAHRRVTLESAVLENSLSAITDSESCVHFPFTTPALLGCGLQLRVEESFDSRFRRLQYRSSIERRHGVWLGRTQKGHITGAYQIALRERQSELYNLLRQGIMAKAGLLNLKSVEQAMIASSRGIGGLDTTLCRIICAELVFREHR